MTSATPFRQVTRCALLICGVSFLFFTGCQKSPPQADAPESETAAKDGPSQEAATAQRPDETATDAAPDVPAPEAAPTAPTGPALSPQQSPQQSPPKPDSPEAPQDPFAVPDGTVEELIAYIDKVQEVPLRSANEAGSEAFQQDVAQHRDKVFGSIIEATQKILDQPASDQTIAAATSIQLQALEQLHEAGNEEALTQLVQLLNRFDEESRPEVLRVVIDGYQKAHELGAPGALDDAHALLSQAKDDDRPEVIGSVLRGQRSLHEAGHEQALADAKSVVDRLIADDRPEVIELVLGNLVEFYQLGDEEALAKLTSAIERLKDDQRPEVAALVSRHQLLLSALEWNTLDEAKQAELLEAFKVRLTADGIKPEQVGFAIDFCDALQQAGDGKAASAAYGILAAAVGQSDNLNLSMVGNFAQMMAERVSLLGQKMELEGTLVDGSSFDWSKYEGKLVLVVFWATWCRPCLQELPNELAHYHEYHDQGFEIVSISLDDDLEMLKTFMEERQLPWPVLYSHDPQAGQFGHPMAEKYGVSGIPAAFLVDGEGTIVSVNARGDALSRQLEKRLDGEPKTAAASGEEVQK